MKYIYLTGVLFISGGLQQATGADYEIKVCDLQAHNTSDNAYLKPCGDWLSKNGCTSGWITWDASKFQGKAMYSASLAALAAGKNIKVRLNGSSCNTYDVTTMIRISSQ